ncbi:MAG: VWA domain-containing protein [Vicinamibacterales bacterium]
MYPFGHLPGNLAAFCAVLRRDHGFRLGPGTVADAARALEVVDAVDEIRVRHALRAVLASDVETAAAFDGAFDAFFFPGPPGVPQPDLPPAGRGEQTGRDGPATGKWRPGAAAAEAPPVADGESAGGTPLATDDDDASAETPAGTLVRAQYSPLSGTGLASVPIAPVDGRWRQAARAVVRRVHLGLSRRWRPARQGRRFDLRRTWRASVQTGGEAVSVRWLRRVHRSPRFALLIDASRSMAGADATALDVAVALAGAIGRIDAYVFSTDLRRITPEVRRAAAGQSGVLQVARDAWGGGTNIGASLRTFLQRHGDRQVNRETVAIVMSDGLDVGPPALLVEGMRALHRRAAAVVWLNPLAATPGFQPRAQGMAAARPYVTTLASVAGPDDLRRLAGQLRLRA